MNNERRWPISKIQSGARGHNPAAICWTDHRHRKPP